MPVDSEPRGNAGVTLSVLQLDSGVLRLILDDVELTASHPRPSWSHKAFVTQKDYEGGAPEVEALTEAELADLGHYLLTRLMACHAQYGRKG